MKHQSKAPSVNVASIRETFLASIEAQTVELDAQHSTKLFKTVLTAVRAVQPDTIPTADTESQSRRLAKSVYHALRLGVLTA